jgi:hypothetical protein
LRCCSWQCVHDLYHPGHAIIVCIPKHATSVHMSAIIPSNSSPTHENTQNKNKNVPSCPYLYAKVQSCSSLYVNKSAIMPTLACMQNRDHDHTCAYTRVIMPIRVCIVCIQSGNHSFTCMLTSAPYSCTRTYTKVQPCTCESAIMLARGCMHKYITHLHTKWRWYAYMRMKT